MRVAISACASAIQLYGLFSSAQTQRRVRFYVFNAGAALGDISTLLGVFLFRLGRLSINGFGLFFRRVCPGRFFHGQVLRLWANIRLGRVVITIFISGRFSDAHASMIRHFDHNCHLFARVFP